MKKIIAIAFAAAMMLAGTNAFAQLRAGAGYINSNFTSSKDGNSSTSNQNGFYAGASYNVALPVSGLSIAPGAYLSMLTKTTTSSADLVVVSGTSTGKFTELGLNFPIHANYSYAIARDAKVFAYAGPTFYLGLSSKTATTTTSSGLVSGTDNSTYDWYAKGDYNKFNLYLGGGIGAEFANIQFVIGYDYGMLDINANTDSGYTYKRANLHVGVGYVF